MSNEILDELELGDKVVFNQQFRRKEEFNRRYYAREQVPLTDGIYIGYRNVSDGRIYTNQSIPYSPTETYKVALVAYDKRKDPVYVPLDNLEIL